MEETQARCQDDAMTIDQLRHQIGRLTGQVGQLTTRCRDLESDTRVRELEVQAMSVKLGALREQHPEIATVTLRDGTVIPV